MIQTWSIRSRSHQCSLSERPFVEGETFHTAIYFDPETSGYLRRDVGLDVWKQEIAERKPIAYWKTVYSPNIVEAKPEVTSKESAMALLQRFIEEDEPGTENARYILALMLERKRILSPTATKEVDGQKILFYENKKTGEVFLIRDPELRLDELAQMQDEVAMLLGFGGPAAEAAKIAGMKFTPDGKLIKADAESPAAPQPEAHAEGETTEVTAEPESEEEPAADISETESEADEASETTAKPEAETSPTSDDEAPTAEPESAEADDENVEEKMIREEEG